MSDLAAQFFEIGEFNAPQILASNTSRPVFKVIFNQDKFFNYYYDDQDENGHFLQQSQTFPDFRFFIQTNFTDFEVPFQVYDGLVSVVSLFIYSFFFQDLTNFLNGII